MKSDFQLQQISTMLKHLLMALKHCNRYRDLKDLSYDINTDEVVITFYGYMKEDHTREIFTSRVNVKDESYADIIHDVENYLHRFFARED